MADNSCDIYPIVNGEPSKLYKDLLEIFHDDRPLVNYIYAAYLQPGVAAQMDNSYTRDNQNQHDAKDVYKFMNLDKLITEQQDLEYVAFKQAGAVDNNGNRISYTDGKQALEKADSFNDSSLGESYVASVTQHGNEFQIYVERKNSMTVESAGIVKEQLKAWETITQAMNRVHIDIKDLVSIYPDVFSPIKIKEMLQWLTNLHSMNPSYMNILSEKDLKLLLTMSASDPLIQRLVTKYGDIDSVAKEMGNWLRTGQADSIDNATRFMSARSMLFNLGGLDIKALNTQIQSDNTNLVSSDKNLMIAETIKSLGEKINPNIISDLSRANKRITKLSDVAVRAVGILSRKLDELKNKKDKIAIIEADKRLSKIMDQIDGKCYFGGTLELIQNVNTDIANLLQAVQNPTRGTRLEQIIEATNNFRSLRDIIDNYEDILEALADLDKIIINENISATDEQTLKTEAKSALARLKEVKKILNGSKTSLAIDILKEYLGEEPINGVPIAVLATHAAQDTGFMDMLFSSTDVTNPLVAALSAIIRRAQQERDKKLTEIGDRIQRATNKLSKADITRTDWMYEPDGHIISDIDWRAYNIARSNYIEQLKAQKIHGYYFDKALLDWEEANTEERIVDTTSGRTERVPIYKKGIPFLNSAQQEYYDTMMQIKGELETMLPEYARDHYTPPQVRMGLIDAMSDTRRNYKGRNRLKRYLKVLLENFRDNFVWREDEEFVDRGGYYYGSYSNVISEPNGTEKRRIPIFYRGTLKDPSMLDKNFSRALGLMASTSTNYEALSNIESMVIYLKHFIKDLNVEDTDQSGNIKASIIRKSKTFVMNNILKVESESQLGGLMEGIVDFQMYGISKFRKNTATKLISTLIKASSVLSLSANTIGAVANATIGHIQTIIEAYGGEFFTFKDWLRAEREAMSIVKNVAVIMDTVNGTKLSIDTLLNERFNVEQKVFSDMKSKHFYIKRSSKIRDSIEATLLYGIGEYNIHQVTFKAILQNEKVLLNGKKVPLRDIFDKTDPVDGVSELVIKPGATRLDGSPITEEYLDSIRDIIKLLNQESHGAMNNEDKGIIHRYLMGKAIMNFRQWMVKHFSRRYKKATKDPLTKRYREGMYVTFSLMLIAGSLDVGILRKAALRIINKTRFADNLDEFKGMYAYRNIKLNKDRMRLANIRKAIMEHAIIVVLLVSSLFDDPEDDDKSWLEYQAFRLCDRLLLECLGSTPLGLPKQSTQLINSPIPSVNTFNKLTYPITGVSDITKEYKRGRFKGENRYWHNIKYNMFPPIKQIDYFLNPDEDRTNLVK